jgi:hypothetical protein
LDYHFLRIALIFSLIGEYNKAVDYLSRINYNEYQPIWLIIEIEANPFFRGIHCNNTYVEILHTLKSNWQKEHDKVRFWLNLLSSQM